MAKQSTGTQIGEAWVYGILLWVISFWTAFVVMVLEGAVGPRLGLPTIGYWTSYLGVMLLTFIGGIWNRDTSYFLLKIREGLDK